MKRALTAVGLAATLLVVPTHASAAELKAGVAVVDASWHVGASAGQYAGDVSEDPEGGTFVHPSEGNYDPTALSTRRRSSYGLQSRLQIRALVVEGPSGEPFALVKNDLYIPQDLLWRRTAQLLEAGSSGIGRENLTMAVSHNHSSPFYSSTSWGVWAFQDVFDVRFYNYYAKRMAEAVERAAESLVPVRVGASVSSFDKTHRHSFGPAIADDGTPAGYPQDDTDHDMTVVRLDDVSDPANPRPLANLVNFGLHPEFLDGNDLISEDYLAPLEAMTDKATGAVTIFTQNAVGTSEPERSSYHSIHERLEFSHREYGQAEFGARLMSDTIVDTWEDIANGTPEMPQKFVPFRADFLDHEVAFDDRWFPGPTTHPYPGVSNCMSKPALEGDPRFPIVGLPDCKDVREGLKTLGFPGDSIPYPPAPPIDPGVDEDDLQRLGIPIPATYSAPSYAALQEDINVHLQAFRIGDIFVPICSCEQWADQSRNIETRTDRVPDNEYLGYDWKQQCTPNPGGTHGQGPEGYDPNATWTCPDPRDPSLTLGPLSDRSVQRMHRQVVNPANGWNDVEYAPQADAEPTDVRQIKGNYTHDDRCGDPAGVPEDAWNEPCTGSNQSPSADRGYRLTVPIAMANDYNGYIATYREYQRGDHYRKALTGWGPHSSDYMASRLVNMGRFLNGGNEQKLFPSELGELKVPADLALNDARAAAVGQGGEDVTAAYEARLPDDGGEPGAVSQPQDVERFDAAFFTWIGGSNYTDDPEAKVQRRLDGQWRDYAGQAGEVPITIEYPDFEDAPPYEAGQHEWRWTAHFEAFASRFETVEGNRATPAGVYRFVVEGQRRENRQPEPYRVESEPFEVRPWSGITVTDIKTEDDGTVSFEAGPTSTNKRHHIVDRSEDPDPAKGNYVTAPEIGPIDYPDSYDHGQDGPLPRFVRNFPEIRLEPGNTDPAAGETFCFDCSFRPWIDFGDASEAIVTVIGPGGSETVPASPARGRWRTSRALAPGESAVVGAGCVKDEFGNYNGAASQAVGADSSAAAVSCPVAQPGDGAEAGGAGGDGQAAGQGVGGAISYALGRCARPTGRVRGLRLGRVRLGALRRRQRGAYPSFSRPRRSVDRFCLTDGRHIRVGYRGVKAVLALSSSRRYRIRGITRGATVGALRARFPRARSFRIGANRWYLARGSRARLVFKVRGGSVREVGIADLALSGGRISAKRFMRGFS
ncbi:MAG TPA: hypothetical protein VHG69_05185 [Thermoleophilaceae bacterium]|nr:hypothetical protein [Thermoleophilaceae bacterium]